MILNFINNLLINLPTSKNLTFKWNFGSMLGMILVFQIVTGVLLVFYYSNDSQLSFSSIQYIMNETSVFSFIRILHFNGVSMFFFFLYLHIFKGLFFFSFRLSKVWMSGLTIYLLIMAEAFMGYAMVWAQMSYWACVVITSLIMVVPIWGNILVNWIWNSFNIWNATLKILFIFHFLIPFMILILMIVHLMFLHESGSSSSIFSFDSSLKMTFFKLYWLKDSLNLIFWLIFLFLSFIFPFKLGDPEMFIDVDLNMSPVHIVPEWYFLFAYAILRAIPNKMLGVVALIFSIFVFYYFSFLKSLKTPLNKFNKTFLYFFILIGIILSWLGQCFVETPFPFLSSLFSILYFLFVLFMILNVFMMNKIFK